MKAIKVTIAAALLSIGIGAHAQNDGLKAATSGADCSALARQATADDQYIGVDYLHQCSPPWTVAGW